MIRHFDHVTVAVRDAAAAERFFGLLGFRREQAVVISGEQFERYMGIAGIEAEHVTLVHESATPRLEVQVLRYAKPAPPPDARVPGLEALGYNHVCFAVDDVEAEVGRLVAGGVTLRNQVMEFHDRKLVFLDGPEGITVELAQWRPAAPDDAARIAILRTAYAAFNRRDVDGALAMLAPDVEWPDMMLGRVLHGTDAVRAYWTQQFATISSQVEPAAFHPCGERVLIEVEQRVRRLDTGGDESSRVGHLYTFRGERVARMEVHADLVTAAAALRAPTGER